MQSKRNEEQRIVDRRIIVKYMQIGGYTIQEITDIINKGYKAQGIDISISRQQVNQDVLSIRKAMAEEYLNDIDQLRIEKVAHFNHIKKTALKDYKKSITEHSRFVERKISSLRFGDSTEETVEKEQLYGNPKFLDIVLKCDVEIAKIQGLYDKKEEKEREKSLNSLTDEELDRQINELENES